MTTDDDDYRGYTEEKWLVIINNNYRRFQPKETTDGMETCEQPDQTENPD